MIIKQYKITLPADYDMQIIRDRVASRGAGFDHFPGLGLKCFLIREKGKFRAPSSQYAPVYLWPTVEAMWGFLAGPAFGAIKESFGTPPVEIWAGLGFVTASTFKDPKQIISVTREQRILSEHADLTSLRESETELGQKSVQALGGPIAEAVALNPHTWELVRFKYWDRTQAELAPELESYEVLHVSAPSFTELAPRQIQ